MTNSARTWEYLTGERDGIFWQKLSLLIPLVTMNLFSMKNQNHKLNKRHNRHKRHKKFEAVMYYIQTYKLLNQQMFHKSSS